MITAQISLFAFFAARIILVILLILSFLVLACFVERFIFFKTRLLGRIEPLLAKMENAGSKQEVITILETINKAETNAVLKGLKGNIPNEAAFRKKVDAWLYPEKEKWERFSVFLGSVGNNAPFIGLLGTVLGILKSFADLSLLSTGGPQVVMAGISEALVATAVGLAVAIPAVIFYNICKVYVKRSVNHVNALMEVISSINLF
ncbi:MAG: MotA/TolQ/ExbB proton channel family protein [Proteobacteria bacterium]|nr:MotA/TolQ/ExbB proton channel family protein [Pseudomonadota bacterium]